MAQQFGGFHEQPVHELVLRGKDETVNVDDGISRETIGISDA